jgi:arylsulfatase A-like enzyme
MAAITRRDFLQLSAATASVVLAAPWPLRAAGGAVRKPNFVLCMTDDQGWGDVSYNGLTACKTPNLDAMAAAGLRLDRFYAAAPVCSPTRGSFLTGRNPNRYGTFQHGYPLRIEERTVAQAAKQAGYTTGHFGKWHLNGVKGPGQPIPAADPLHPGRFGFDEWLSVSNFFDLNWTLSRRGKDEKFTGDGSDYIASQAAKFMADAVKDGKPFLAVVWFGNPHSPHQALAADQTAAGGSAYYGEIVAIDRAMGALRKALRDLGVADNTMLLFCSDNGATKTGSTGNLRGNKGSLWEGGLAVPGVIEWPSRIAKPAVSNLPACTSDIYPTVVEALGVNVVKQPQPLDGMSLLPLLAGRMKARGAGIGFWYGLAGRSGAARGSDVGHAAWTEDRYKLHKVPGGTYELYDLAADRKETKDLAAELPKEVERMKADLAKWQESVEKSLKGDDYR